MTKGFILCLAVTPAVQRTLIMDRMRPGQVNRAKRVRLSAAGKGVNVAAALARLGQRPVLVGFKGGAGGELIAREMAALGVDARWVETVGETRHCHTCVELAGRRVTEWVEEAPIPTAAEWKAFRLLLSEMIKGASWLVISGAFPPGFSLEALSELAAEAAAEGVSLFVDTQGRPLLELARLCPEWVKINADEIADALGLPIIDRRTRVSALSALKAMGPRHVMTTDGEFPAHLVTADGHAVELTPPPVAVLNTIGSGDCVTAGILHALTAGADAVEAARYGLACGSANAMTEVPALIDRNEVERLLTQIPAVPFAS